jgi:hypothetical protein
MVKRTLDSSKSSLLNSLNIGKGKSVLEVKGAKLNLVFLSDLHSLDLFKSQPVPGSIINPGGRRTGMSGNPLRDLDRAARIHVFGDASRSEAVTTNSFQDPACPRPFLNRLQDTPTSRRLDSIVSRFLPKEGQSGALEFDARCERLSQRSIASLAFECTGESGG